MSPSDKECLYQQENIFDAFRKSVKAWWRKEVIGAAGKKKKNEKAEYTSIDDMQHGNILIQHLAALSAANSAAILGLALGWTSAALPVAEGGQGFPVSLEQWSWVTSSYTLGAALGAPAVGPFLSALGRRWVILFVSPLTAAAWALHLWASQVWMLYVGRVLMGIGSGVASVAVPIYVSEISEPAIRGALSTYFEVTICLGILVVYILGAWLPVFWMNAFCLAFSVLHGACFLCFPDTPRWFLLQNRRDEARKALIFYRGKGYDVDSELNAIQAALKENYQATTSWLAAFGTKAARKGLAFTTVLLAFQQITGVNAVTFYASKLFTEAGTFDAHVASVIVAASEVAAAFVSMMLVDRLGRRVLLLSSAAIMGVSTGFLGTYFYLKDETGVDVSPFSWLPIIFVSIYMFMFSIGFGPVSWVFLGEIFPDSIKGVATSLATAVCWFFAFLVTKFYPGISQNLGEYTCYWIFCVLCVLSCILIYTMPETKGRTLDEIQADLSGKSRREILKNSETAFDS